MWASEKEYPVELGSQFFSEVIKSFLNIFLQRLDLQTITDTWKVILINKEFHLIVDQKRTL
jgi:hypothetical protein